VFIAVKGKESYSSSSRCRKEKEKGAVSEVSGKKGGGPHEKKEKKKQGGIQSEEGRKKKASRSVRLAGNTGDGGRMITKKKRSMRDWQ